MEKEGNRGRREGGQGRRGGERRGGGRGVVEQEERWERRGTEEG